MKHRKNIRTDWEKRFIEHDSTAAGYLKSYIDGYSVFLTELSNKETAFYRDGCVVGIRGRYKKLKKDVNQGVKLLYALDKYIRILNKIENHQEEDRTSVRSLSNHWRCNWSSKTGQNAMWCMVQSIIGSFSQKREESAIAVYVEFQST